MWDDSGPPNKGFSVSSSELFPAKKLNTCSKFSVATEIWSSVCSSFDAILKKTKARVTKEILGENFLKNVNEYREIFPDFRLPSKELGRQTVETLSDRFVKFFKKYPKYDWELVLDAADYYVNYYKKVDYKYMTCSLYFIEKDGISKLADTCQAIIDNPKILDI